MPSSGKASNSRALSDNVAFMPQKLTNKFHIEKIKYNWDWKKEEKRKNLNLNNSGRRGVLPSFGIVVEYLRRRNHLWSRRHPFTTPKTLKPTHQHSNVIFHFDTNREVGSSHISYYYLKF